MQASSTEGWFHYRTSHALRLMTWMQGPPPSEYSVHTRARTHTAETLVLSTLSKLKWETSQSPPTWTTGHTTTPSNFDTDIIRATERGVQAVHCTGPMTRRGAHENMWHDIAVQVCFLGNLIGDEGPNCDLYRGLFNLSAALDIISPTNTADDISHNMRDTVNLVFLPQKLVA